MGLWDYMKPSKVLPAPEAVDIAADGRLVVRWKDGSTTEATGKKLRGACPCAGCVDEWTKQRTFDPEKLPEDLRPERVHAVGNYALGVTFSDGHDTGIFEWGYLRQVTQSPAA